VDAALYPNPYKSGSDLNIMLSLSRDCVKVSYRIYTSSFRLVVYDEEDVPLAAGDRKYPIKSSRLGRLAAGTYYAVITAADASGRRARAAIKVLIIIK
jgi:hypothetical protein